LAILEAKYGIAKATGATDKASEKDPNATVPTKECTNTREVKDDSNDSDSEIEVVWTMGKVNAVLHAIYILTDYIICRSI